MIRVRPANPSRKIYQRYAVEIVRKLGLDNHVAVLKRPCQEAQNHVKDRWLSAVAQQIVWRLRPPPRAEVSFLAARCHIWLSLAGSFPKGGALYLLAATGRDWSYVCSEHTVVMLFLKPCKECTSLPEDSSGFALGMSWLLGSICTSRSFQPLPLSSQ